MRDLGEVHFFVCACFLVFCFEGWMWDLIVLVSDHCLSFNIDSCQNIGMLLLLSLILTAS